MAFTLTDNQQEFIREMTRVKLNTSEAHLKWLETGLWEYLRSNM